MMATLIKRKSKVSGKTLWTVQVVLTRSKRPCVPLGEVTKSQALQAKGYIESLASTRRGNLLMPPTTADWLRGLDDDFYALLASRGLCDPRQGTEPAAEPVQVTLGEFVDGYIGKRSDVKGGTSIVYGHTRRCLIEYFGADRPLSDITVGDAKDWRRWLTRPTDKGGQGLAENTARRRCSIAKQFFADGVERELIGRNPFAKMKGISVGANRARDYFITRDEAEAVLNACPDAQWKLLFALSRYGGLRCPSEHLALTWGDVNWERARITVRSSKTAHHGDGHEERVMPLFPELLPYLEAAKNELLEDFDPKAKRLSEQPVISRYRDSNSNLRTQLLRIIKRAGLTAWPKLFQNLRASRATELAAEYPGHVAAAWLGHSNKIADDHYRQVTDADFERAARAANALQQSTETRDSDGNRRNSESENKLDVRLSRENRTSRMSPAGLEPTTYGLKVRCSTN
jgi:integrase